MLEIFITSIKLQWVNYGFAFSQNEKTFSKIVAKFRRTFCVRLLILSAIHNLTIFSTVFREETELEEEQS